jgi:hypothetical protein
LGYFGSLTTPFGRSLRFNVSGEHIPCVCGIFHHTATTMTMIHIVSKIILDHSVATITLDTTVIAIDVA